MTDRLVTTDQRDAGATGEHLMPSSQAWDELLTALSHDESVLACTLERIRSDVPGYEAVPDGALRFSVRRNIGLSIRAVRAGEHPRPEQLDEAAELAAERHAQAVPVGSVLAGFRACMSVILHRILELAPRAGIPPAEVLVSSTVLWALGDAFSARAVAVYQEKDVAGLLADSERRSEWIGQALTAAMEPSDLRQGAALYDVPVSQPVRAMVVHAAPGAEGQRMSRLQAWAERAEVRVLTTVRGQALIGILLGVPARGVQPEKLTIGLGVDVLLDELPVSFDAASSAVHAAQRVGWAGVVDPETLSWRMAVHTSPETTALLAERYVAPLEGTGEFGDHVLEAVEASLSHRLSIPLAAHSIPVHVNTLRYRLQRFSQLTGADLGDTGTLVELSWVFAARGGDASRALMNGVS